MASHLDGLATNETLQKVMQLVPANVFAFFHAVVTYITPTGTCDRTQQAIIWALFVVVTLATAYIAIHNRHIPASNVRPCLFCATAAYAWHGRR